MTDHALITCLTMNCSLPGSSVHGIFQAKVLKWGAIAFSNYGTLHSSHMLVASHSSTFAWKIPWTEEPGGLQSMGLLESDTTERLHFHFSLSCIGERNGNPLQCSCLENPRDGEAWWAAVSGVAQSRTRLKQHSSSSSSSSKLSTIECFSFPYISPSH